MKKMSCKEFKEILEQSGMHFDNWGWEGIMNIMVNHYSHLAKEAFQENFEPTGRHYIQRRNYLFNCLKERGYYGESE